MGKDRLNFSEALLVLGMHRSGSSALTRCLSVLGYALPRNLIKDNRTNLRGHWECQPLARLNDSYLEEAGLEWSDWRSGGLDRVGEGFRRDFQTDLWRLLASEFPSDVAPVIKEPRICRLGGTYKDFFKKNGVAASYVVVFRHPHEVCSSLGKRNGLRRLDAALLWLRYTLDAAMAARGEPCVFVAYDKLLDDPIAVLSHICDCLSLNPLRRLEDASDEIAAFLSSDLRHNTSRTEDVIHDDLTRGWISDVYEALRILAKNPTAHEPLETLSRVHAEFTAACPFLDAALTETRDAAAEADEALKTANAASELRAEQIRILRDEKIQAARMHEEIEAALRGSVEEERQVAAAQKKQTEKLTLRQLDHERNARADLQDAQNVAAAQKKQIEKLTLRQKELEKAERRLQRRYLRVQDELAYRKDMIANLHNSTMWRLTAPLRRGVEIYRGVRHSIAARLSRRRESSDTASAQKEDKPSQASPVADASKAGLVRESNLFDQAWYLASYPDAQLHPTGAAAHYVTEGWRKGYDPSAAFNTKAYIASHKDLLDPDECPLVHYLTKKTDRKPTSSRGRENQKIAVFTAIAGEYDLLVEPAKGSAGADFFVFTDDVNGRSSVWRQEPFEYVSGDPTRTARFVKTHPHLYFRDYDWAIWLDGNLILNCDPRELLPTDDISASVFTWKHPLRNCVYEEGKECIRREKDDTEIIEAHIHNLRKSKFPERAGLFETSVFVTRLGAPDIKAFYDAWWSEIDRGSKRDQLSLPVAIKKSGVKVGFLGDDRMCMRTDPRVLYHRHVQIEDARADQ